MIFTLNLAKNAKKNGIINAFNLTTAAGPKYL